MKITKVGGIGMTTGEGVSINVLEMVSDVLSLLLKMDEQLNMDFEAEKIRTEVLFPQ